MCQGILFNSDRVTKSLIKNKTETNSPDIHKRDSSGEPSPCKLSLKPVSRDTITVVEKYIDFFRLICL